MKEPALGEKIGALLCVVVSAAGFVWLVTLPKPPLISLIQRLGFVAAAYSCLWFATLSWAACFAYVSRKRDWSPRACVLAGLPFLAAGVLVLFLSNNQSLASTCSMLVFQSFFATGIASKLAFPGLTTEQSAALVRPPTLFPK
jgi:hypothetical protein